MGALMGGKPVDLAAIEAHTAFLVAQRTADAIDQRTLAGAVRPDQAEALTGRYREQNVFKRDKAAEPLAEIIDLKQIGVGAGHGADPGASVSTRRPTNSSGLRCQYLRTSPTMPFGATMTKPTRRQPTINKLTADEIVTVAICCSEPSSTAPTSGPIQLVVPPISGMAIELTA